LSNILIIGYGNPLREDDAAGFLAAEKLAEIYAKDDSIEVMPLIQLTPELAEPISRAKLVVFIDTALEGAPGHILIEEIGITGNGSGSHAHDLRPAAIMQMAKSLYSQSPKAYLITITGLNFGLKQGLTETLHNRLSDLIQTVTDVTANYK